MTEKMPADKLFPDIEKVHADCAVENGALEDLFKSFSTLGAIPHCVFGRLASEIFLVPLNALITLGLMKIPDSKKSLEKSKNNTEQLEIFSSCTILKQVSHEQILHVDVKGITLFSSPLFAKIKKLIINPGHSATVTISEHNLEKLSQLARDSRTRSRENPQETVEIRKGDEMILSAPEAEPPAEFLTQLRRIFGSDKNVKNLFIYEAGFQNGETSLVLGVVPREPATEGEFDGYFTAIMSDIEKYFPDQNRIDFIILEDPEMIEAIAATVKPINF